MWKVGLPPQVKAAAPGAWWEEREGNEAGGRQTDRQTDRGEWWGAHYHTAMQQGIKKSLSCSGTKGPLWRDHREQGGRGQAPGDALGQDC